MGRIVFNDYLDAGLAGLFAAIVVTMVVYGMIDARRAWHTPRDTTAEIGPLRAMATGDD
jgi:carbon starvation protein